jgi:alanyl-tRNA synthetase
LIEIWNLVFIQYNLQEDGSLIPLVQKFVDTGAGLERLVAMVESTQNFTNFDGVELSVYDTDIFEKAITELELSSGYTHNTYYKNSNKETHERSQNINKHFRIIVDHLRTISWAVEDGILPGNKDRNYIIRKLIRRAIRSFNILHIHLVFHKEFQDLVKNEGLKKILKDEYDKYMNSVSRCIYLFDKETKGLKEGDIIPASFVFLLYDTHGLNYDVIEEVARDKKLRIVKEDFDKLLDEQRQRSKTNKRK